ncbi:MAG: hypothetical protein AVO35_10000 [Candidatus Aegiribacteria sp. MLS_C]|nr:MAG: hypothetical protein AVO35_10000 [Candidatus Aegiribacteria sp. MLS_C]
MNTFGSILVPVDLGGSTERILRTAGELAEAMDASVSVLHVVQPMPLLPLAAGDEQMAPQTAKGFNIPVYQKTIEDRARSAMEELVGRTIPGERVAALQVRTGTVGTSILDECRSGDYDLVIMDSGEDHLLTKLFGSVTDKVVKNAPVPVLVLRGPKQEEEE